MKFIRTKLLIASALMYLVLTNPALAGVFTPYLGHTLIPDPPVAGQAFNVRLQFADYWYLIHEDYIEILQDGDLILVRLPMLTHGFPSSGTVTYQAPIAPLPAGTFTMRIEVTFLEIPGSLVVVDEREFEVLGEAVANPVAVPTLRISAQIMLCMLMLAGARRALATFGGS